MAKSLTVSTILLASIVCLAFSSFFVQQVQAQDGQTCFALLFSNCPKGYKCSVIIGVGKCVKDNSASSTTAQPTSGGSSTNAGSSSASNAPESTATSEKIPSTTQA